MTHRGMTISNKFDCPTPDFHYICLNKPILLVIMKHLLFSIFVSAASLIMAQGWDESLNTAKDVMTISETEREVIFEINKLRSDPPRYAREVVKPRLAKFHSDGMVYTNSQGIYIRTSEGKTAVAECIQALESTAPMQPLYHDSRLYNAAKSHGMDMRDNNFFEHDSSDGTQFYERLQKFGFKGHCAENLAAGNDAPEEIVLQLIIDDGVPSRGHRTNLLTPDFNIIGASVVEHPQWRYSCTMDLGEVDKAKEASAPASASGTGTSK